MSRGGPVLWQLVLSEDQKSSAGPHLACPFCSGYEIGRMYIASADIDSCECLACGARWDESRGSGQYLGRSARSSVLAPRSE